MTSNQYDAIIIGGGHNGLVAGAYLARAGKRVVVLERRHIVGGAAVTEEIFPGYKFTEFSYAVSLLRPEIIRDLELPKHGLKILPLPSTFTPMENGDYLAAWDDHDLTRRYDHDHDLFGDYFSSAQNDVAVVYVPDTHPVPPFQLIWFQPAVSPVEPPDAVPTRMYISGEWTLPRIV